MLRAYTHTHSASCTEEKGQGKILAVKFIHCSLSSDACIREDVALIEHLRDECKLSFCELTAQSMLLGEQ